MSRRSRRAAPDAAPDAASESASGSGSPPRPDADRDAPTVQDRVNYLLWTRRPVGGPVRRPWREGTLTRAKELESLGAWAAANSPPPGSEMLLRALELHVTAARQAAQTRRRWFPDQALLERAISNLDAAEALLLDVGSRDYLLARLPGVLNDAVRHLAPADCRRRQLEVVAQEAGLCLPFGPGGDGVVVNSARRGLPCLETRLRLVHAERLTIAAAMRAARSAALREQLRVRSFRNVLRVTTALLGALAVVLAVIGWQSPASLPLCFAPEEAGRVAVVCPTEQTAVALTRTPSPAPGAVDRATARAVNPIDVLLVEVLGLAAAAVAAAAAIRGIRGSSEPHGLPVAVALLKLPTGAITALLGLLLMRGEFVPGLTALDSPAQILAWALVFGYGQQLFTRLVDQQANTVLNSVRSGEKNRTEARDAHVTAG